LYKFPETLILRDLRFFTVLLIKTQVFWDVTRRRQVIIDASKDPNALYCTVKSFLLDYWALKMQCVPSNRRQLFTVRHRVTAHKI